MESNLENNTASNLLMNTEDFNLRPIQEKHNSIKLEIANEIYSLLDDFIKKEIDNSYKSNNLVHKDTLFETYWNSLKNFISFDIQKYNDVYKLYKYIKNGNFYYITFNVTTKKYYKLLSKIETINDNDIINNSEVLFESENWNEIVENVINR